MGKILPEPKPPTELSVTVALHTASHQEVASVLYVLYCHRNDIIRVIYFKICTFYDCI